jgi:hypothetical protein
MRCLVPETTSPILWLRRFGYVVTASLLITVVLSADGSQSTYAALDARIRELETKVEELEKRIGGGGGNDKDARDTVTDEPSAPMKVKAPFEVVNKEGKPILQVVERGTTHNAGMILYNTSGNQIAYFGASQADLGMMSVGAGQSNNSAMVRIGIPAATPEVGVVRIQASNGDRVAELGSTDDGHVALRIGQAGANPAAEFGELKTGGTGAVFRNRAGQTIAGIGASPDRSGEGVVKLSDAKGTIHFAASGATGAATVFSDAGKEVAAFGRDGAGRGFFRVLDLGGKELVSLQDNGKGQGRVQVWDAEGREIVIGVRTNDLGTYGDVCASGARLFCLSTAAAKTLTPYWK